MQRLSSTQTIDHIKEVVAKAYGIEVSKVSERTRMNNGQANPRHVAIYLCKALFPDAINSSIAPVFGLKSEMAVIIACGLMEKRIENDEEFRSWLEEIKRNITTNP